MRVCLGERWGRGSLGFGMLYDAEMKGEGIAYVKYILWICIFLALTGRRTVRPIHLPTYCSVSASSVVKFLCCIYIPLVFDIWVGKKT
jgi:hypothetical protein